MFPDPLLKHAFPFKEPRLSKMHRAVVDFIYSRSYSFKLPPLSQESWSELAHNAEQRERLQFLGDSHMHGFVARELYTIHPNETPCYYTVITTLYLTSYCNEFGFVQSARSVLTANSTYAHLLCKIGFHDIKEPVKPAGDTFESLLGKYYAERGEAVFVTYAKKFFRPLMDTAGRAHSDYRRTARHIRRQRNHQSKVQKYLLTRHHAKDKRRGHFSTLNSNYTPGGSRGRPLTIKQKTMVNLATDSNVSREKYRHLMASKPLLLKSPIIYTQTPLKSFPSLQVLRQESPDIDHATEETSERQSYRIPRAISVLPHGRTPPQLCFAFELRPPVPGRSSPTASDGHLSSGGKPERSHRPHIPLLIKGIGTSDDPFVVD